MVVARKWVVNYLGDVPGGQFNFDFSSEKSTFALKEEEISEDDLKDGEILIKSLYYGNDPTQKFWISSIDKNYSKGKEVGDLVPAVGLAEVVASRNKEYRVGDFIKGMIGWATYTILSDLSGLQKISADGVRDISWHITLFGIPAMTAFFNLFEYAGLKETEADYGKVYLISGAAGGVGTMSIQLALNVFKASKVIAVAGGQEKVKYLESFGDKVVGVDYKDANFAKNLVAAAGSENTVDYFIDNVGGDTLELGVNLLLKPHATLISCGIISGYNDPSKLAFKSYPTVISKRLTIRGVLLSDHYSEFPVAMKKLTQWVEDGKVDIEKTVTIEDGTGDNFKNVPLIWNGLYEGKNIGRLVTRVASPEKDAKL